MKITKACKHCQIAKELSEFSSAKTQPDGLMPICKKCLKLDDQIYVQKPEAKERNRNYKKTPEQYSKDKLKRENVDGQYIKAKSSAKTNQIPFDLTKEEFRDVRSGDCFYCGGDLPKEGTGLDRIDISLSYNVQNVVPCCQKCNLMKTDHLTVMEMKTAADAIKDQRLRAIDTLFVHGFHLDSRTIYLSKEVDSAMALMVVAAMTELETINRYSPITFIVMSEGGCWVDALAIYDRISISPCPIIMKAYGLVASAATAIFQAGDERIVSVNSRFLIHDGSEAFEGTPRSFKSWAKASEQDRKLLYEIYSHKSGKPSNYWESRCSHDTWFTAEEIVSEGLADFISIPSEAKKKLETK